MTEPKPVKAWAVTDHETNLITLQELYASETLAVMHCLPEERVIPVTITPGHEAEDD
jgi:hypothetical protein